jgi:hypothetical protein
MVALALEKHIEDEPFKVSTSMLLSLQKDTKKIPKN